MNLGTTFCIFVWWWTQVNHVLSPCCHMRCWEFLHRHRCIQCTGRVPRNFHWQVCCPDKQWSWTNKCWSTGWACSGREQTLQNENFKIHQELTDVCVRSRLLVYSLDFQLHSWTAPSLLQVSMCQVNIHPTAHCWNWWQTESMLLWQSSTTWLLQLNIGPPWHFSSWAFKATLVCSLSDTFQSEGSGTCKDYPLLYRDIIAPEQRSSIWSTRSREYTDGAKPSYTQFGSLGYTLRCTNTHYIVWKFSVLVWTCVCDYICVFCPTNQFWELVEAVSSRTTSCFVDRRLTVVDHHLVTSCWYMQGPLFTQVIGEPIMFAYKVTKIVNKDLHCNLFEAFSDSMMMSWWYLQLQPGPDHQFDLQPC